METRSSDLRSPPRRCAPASAPYLKHQNQRSGLTEIFGGAPGSGLALAQGEAALSAQEAPHPCPACGGARSSQPPVTSCLEAGAAVERPQTPLCRSSPGLDSLPPSLPLPAEQINPNFPNGHIWAEPSPQSLSDDQRKRAQERIARGVGVHPV